MDVATRYKLLEKIGAGSFATVFRAQDQELGREVAVKQIHAQFLAETALFERYWKEATLLASFQHPHIVTIYDVVRAQGWLVLELMQANLRDRLQGRPMDVKAVQTTLTQGLRALSALHSRGLVHGDIKPSNLMIDHRKRVKVGDFGLARRVSHDDGSVIRGTAKYMAPETLSQDFGDVGPQSDLYSLGFTAYELMCGSKFETLFPGLDAFGRDRQAAWMMWHAALDRKLPEPGKALEGVPPALARVIGRLVEKDPKKRYETADQALADLGAAPAEPMTRTADSGSARKSPGDRPKSRGLVIALFCASMAASLAMLFWTPGQSPPPGPGQTPGSGIVRSVDPESNTIEFVDPTTGQPEELVVAEKTPIRLRSEGNDELVLLKRLQKGDWIRTATEEGRLRIDVSRPVTQTGRIAAIDPLASKITVMIDGARQRERVTLTVPASVSPLLNDEKVTLRDLAVDDGVMVDHLLDPAGKQGQIASGLRAMRTIRSSGTVIDFDPSTSMLSVSSGVANEGPLKLRLVPSSELKFDDDSPATVADLKPGQAVDITRHRVITSIVIPRDVPQVTGTLVGIDPATRSLRIQSSGAESEVKLADDARLTLNDAPATLDELRSNSDQVTVLSPAGNMAARTVRVVRGPRYDRAVVAIEASTNQDRSLPVIENAGKARALQTAAIQRYATPPEWAVHLTEPTREEVLSSLRQRLEGLRASSQAIVSITAQAFLVDESPVLAFADYRPNEAGSTGVPLADVLALIDAAPPSLKVVFLDVVHPRPGLEDVPPSAEALMKNVPKTKTTTVLIAPPETGAANATDMGSLVVQGLRGAADADRDLAITPAEWIEYLTKGATPTGVTVWPQ
ncbi:Serine/threonine-protein kinase PknB [Caulifigura coniformis]|uniref:Serine/threonine-protein kinase PknB n=1 Tax=Caulifigura coniformis TaxID=2527983 RepID=A0A517SA27_9PLAN|nr:serine/threonine-protein kinase [Caulifigura coniformis]QDT52936.1 Serine/threonine-protein kinase PknB [Caulifigura coniformis]